MFKRIGMHLLLGVFAVALLATGAWSGSAIELTYANFPPPKTFPSIQMERWVTEVAARTEGKVSVKTFPGGTLLKAKAMMDGVMDGVADIGCVAFPYQPGRFQLLAGVDLPIGFPNSKVANAVLWDLYKKYDPSSLKGVKVLALFTAPPASIMSKNPIRQMSDLSGYELRATGAGVAPLKILGAVPVSMPMPATVEALQKGVVKGVLSSTDILMDFKFAEQVFYTTRSDLQTTSFGVLMNLDKWNSLPADVKKVFEDLAREQSMWTGSYVDDHGKESVEWSKKNHKHEYIELAADEYAKWHDLMQPITDEWMKKTTAKGLPAQAFLNDLLLMKLKYEAEFAN
jgi:TRAP-type C4-dicarboxylate transport system substrate-binding protein